MRLRAKRSLKELSRDALMFDGHIMSRQEVCLGQLFPLNELSWGKLVCLLFSSMANKDSA